MFVSTSLISAMLIGSASAFRSALKPSNTAGLKMSYEGYGAVAPLGYFDPLGLSTGKSQLELKKYREAELKHGRVAMLAFLGILVGESFNPLWDGKVTGPAIYQFQQVDDIFNEFWVLVLFAIGLVEGQTILKGWQAPGDVKFGTVAGLKEDYTPGDLNFDPLGFKPSDPAELETLQTKEINNGRLAMLGVAGIVAQELVDGKTILEHFSS